MIGSVADTFETKAAGWIHHALLLEEEHCPLPEDASPADLLLHVSERLAQAASAIEDQEQGMATAYFLRGAACSITAITYLPRNDEALARTELKDRLLEELDQSIAKAEETDSGVPASPDQLLRSCLSLLAPAFEYPDDEEQVSEALWQLACSAALAFEQLVQKPDSPLHRE